MECHYLIKKGKDYICPECYEVELKRKCLNTAADMKSRGRGREKLVYFFPRRSNRDDFTYFVQKACCDFSFELPLRDSSNEGSQHIFIEK